MNKSAYVTLSIDEVRLDPRNERLHPPAQIEILKISILRFGQRRRVLIDRKNKVIAHHGVVMALRALGRTKVKCKYVEKEDMKKPISAKQVVLPIDDVIDDPKNENLHPAEQMARLQISIRLYGQQESILVDRQKKCIAGHGIKAAMKAEGYTHIRCEYSDLKGTKRDAYRIISNQLARLSHFDPELLDLNVADIMKRSGKEFEPEWIGFSENELNKIRGRGSANTEDAPPAQIDRAAELQRKWKVRRGDLWIIGNHKLLCGDCTKADDVARLMGRERAVMMNTDPPYGVDYVAVKQGIPRPGFKNIQETKGDIKNDDLTDGAQLQLFLEAMIRAALPHLSKNPAFYFWHPMLTQGTFFAAAAAAAAAAADILIHRQIIWVKPGFVLTRSGMYHWKHELCFYGWIKGKPCDWYGDKSQTSVWEVGKDEDAGMHPTQKPVELFLRPIMNHTKKRALVYEPFGGSGSQLCAAEQTGRRCFALEIEPKFCAVILERLTEMGLAPRLLKKKTKL